MDVPIRRKKVEEFNEVSTVIRPTGGNYCRIDSVRQAETVRDDRYNVGLKPLALQLAMMLLQAFTTPAAVSIGGASIALYIVRKI